MNAPWGTLRRTDDAAEAIRRAVQEGRLDPNPATRWLLALSKVALERQVALGSETPRRRGGDV